MKVNEIISEASPVKTAIGDLIDKGVDAYKNYEKKRAADDAKKAREKTMKNWYGGKIDINKLSRKERNDLIKKRAEAGTAARKAVEAYSTMDKAMVWGVNSLGLAAAIIEYYTTSKQVEEEYKLYEINREESMYAAAETARDAYRYFQSDLELATGKLVAEVALIMTKTPAAKLFSLLTGRWGTALAALLGAGLGFAATDDVGGAAVGAGTALAGVVFIKKKLIPALKGRKIDAASKALILTFLNSDAGHKWLENSIVGSALRVVGGAFKPYLDKAAEFVKSYDGFGSSVTTAVGNLISPASDTKPPPKTQAELDQEKQDAEFAAANAKVPYNLQMWKEKGVTFIGGKAVTDDKGNLLPGLNDFMNRTAVAAKQLQVPNPFDSIAKPANYKTTAY